VSDAGTDAQDDPFLWLEDVTGERALAWVHERNARTRALFGSDGAFHARRERLAAVLDAPGRIPQVTRHGAWLYNLWQDAAHPRGLWRRATLAEFRRAHTRWQTVLDLDRLAADEAEPWVFRAAHFADPASPRCLLRLSRGGADAVVVREFDADAGRFVAHNAFVLPEAKTEIDWLDADTVLVGTDTGPGSMTTSGYPRTLRRWARGTPLADAPLVFEGEPGDAWVHGLVDRTPGHERLLFVRGLDFFRSRRWLAAPDGARTPLDLPDDATVAFWNHAGSRHDRLLVFLASDWPTGGFVHARGTLLCIGVAAFLAGDRRFDTVFAPTPARCLGHWTTTRRHVVLQVLEHVDTRVEECRPGPGGWTRRSVDTPRPGTATLASLAEPALAEDPLADRYWIACAGFLVPDRLMLARAGGHAGRARHERAPRVLKSQPEAFDAAGMHAEQRFATSADGTRVPYFVVHPAGAAGRAAPTLLHGYGGFEIPLLPWYLQSVGPAWLAAGGRYVVANIRGGSEYGPAWHRAALRDQRQRAVDDFIAVAQALVADGFASPATLGIQGGSNGGLLVGNTMLQRPDLFGAVVGQVPLLDMRRYPRLLAGASWMAEYGNPDDPADWAWLQRLSPYHALRADTAYPPVLFTTSTRDDRVHPGHARKMAAKMQALGHEAHLFENTEGGHGLAADNAQRAAVQALAFSFLWQKLAGARAAPGATAPPRRAPGAR
jgi:prolyl oligopeptidase